MKKLSILLLVGCSSAIYAQDVKYGATATAHGTLINEVHSYSKPRLGGSIGAFATIPLNANEALKPQNMFIQPQVEFSTQGERANESSLGKQEFYNNYITAVAYFKYFFTKGETRSNFFAFAGPKFEYLVSDSRSTTPAYEAAFGDGPFEKEINKFGFGLSGGAGYALSSEFEVFLRYDQGLSKIYPDKKGNTFNNVFGVGLNYTFSSKKSATDAVEN